MIQPSKLKAAISFLLFFFFILMVSAQSPGLIVRPAGGPYSIILDPNQNGYTSSTTSGFSTNDISQSEIAYKVVPPAVTEPTGDLATGPSGGFTDIVKTVDNSGFYIYSDGTNLYFRLRIGGIISGSKGYSVLIDSDNRMGNSGPYADPNFVAATNTSNGNPGFEYEVVLQTNFRVEVYNVNGTGNPVSSSNYPLATHSQISVALSRDGNNPDYFYDWYVPLTAIGSPASIRMAATTVTSPGSALQGSRSDVYGIDDASSTLTNAWQSVVNAQPTISIGAGGISSVGATCTAPPTINSPISAGSSVSVSGSWTRMDASKPSNATVSLYRDGVLVNTTTVATGNTWSITVPVVATGNVFYAKAVATGESECLQSASVTASSCTVLPTAPVITCASQKGISGNIPSGSTILLYQVSSASGNPTTTPVSTNITYPTATTFAYYNNNCGGSGSPLTAGITYMVQTVSATGCVSGSTLICIQGSSSVNSLPTNTISLTSPIYPFHTSIAGSNATTGELIRLFINDVYVASQTATASAFTFTGLTLNASDQVKIYSQGTTCMTTSSSFSVSCYNTPPIINTDVNGKLLSTATSISGTSTPNASITLNRTSPTAASWATTANSSGAWTISGLTLASGDIFSATVTSSTCATASQASSSANVVNPTTTCPAITGTYTDANTSVSGNINTAATGTIRLYLDNVLIGSHNVVATGASTWTISSLTYPLYNGGILRASFQAGTDAENAGCASVAVTCNSPSAPGISPTSSTINTGQTVSYNISNVVSNTWYAVTDASSISYATSVFRSGTTSFPLTTNTFTTAGTYNIRISADKLSGCPASYTNATITVNLQTLPASFKQVKGKKIEPGNEIRWEVADEINVLHYIVERSENCRDFQSIGTVQFNNSGSATNQYSFVDDALLRTSNFCYRIKQVDVNGKFIYSSIITLAVRQENSLAIWPNPAVSKALVSFNNTGSAKANVELYDAKGTRMLTRRIVLQPGNNTFSIDHLEIFSKGLYILKIKTGKQIFSEKLVIK